MVPRAARILGAVQPRLRGPISNLRSLPLPRPFCQPAIGGTHLSTSAGTDTNWKRRHISADTTHPGPASRRHREHACTVERRASGSAGSVMPPGMEVEVKLRLPSAEAHAQVASLFKDSQEATFLQENVFFNGTHNELSDNRITLRIRFYNDAEKCVVTVKGKSVLVDGIGRSSEEEETIEPQKGRAYVDNPELLMTSTSPLISGLRERLGIKGFVCLGGFKNIRMVFGWKDYKIELDETKFPFGTQYEIECESENAEQLKKDLEAVLTAQGIPFRDSTATKFSTFRAGRLLD